MIVQDNDEHTEGSSKVEELFDSAEHLLKNYGQFKDLYSKGISLRSQRAQKAFEAGKKLVAKAVTNEDGKPIFTLEVNSSIGNVVVSVNHDKVYYTVNNCDPSLTFVQDEIRVIYKNIVKVMNTLDPILQNLDFFGETYNKALTHNEMLEDGISHLKVELDRIRLWSKELETTVKQNETELENQSKMMKSFELSRDDALFRYYIASAISLLSLCGFGYTVIS